MKVLLDEYGLLKNDVDAMENILQQHLPEIYGSVVIRGKRHGHVLVRSLNELKQHVFGNKSPLERGTSSHGSDGSLRSFVNTPESRTQASSDSASTVETIHDNIMKQSQMVLNNIDDIHGVNKPRAPVVNWQDVCQSIASQLVTERAVTPGVPLDTTKVMPLFSVMLKELDISVEPPAIVRPDPQCLPRQVLGLARTMESELGASSTNGSSIQFLSTPAAGSVPADSIGAEVQSEDRSSTSSDRQPVDHERLNKEYEVLKKERLFMLVQAYTGNPDPDALLARARGQAGIATPANNCSKVVDGSDGETEAVKKLEASRARMYAMKEKLRLNQSNEYHITNGSGDNVAFGDASQSKIDVNSRRRLAEAMSVQVVSQRQNLAVARPWKKTVDPLQQHTTPNCFFSKPLMSSSPREESSHTPYTEVSQSVQTTQPMHHQQQRQIYPHKKGYMSAEEFADDNYNSDVASNAESENYVDDGIRYQHTSRVNGGNWHTQKRRVPFEKDPVYLTQGDRYGVGGDYRDTGVPQYDDTLNRSMESLLSSRGDDNVVGRVQRWQLTRQAQSCWNLTNCHTYNLSGVSSRQDRAMTIPDRCRGLTQHSQSLVDISSSRQSLIDASETDSRLDTSAHSVTELNYADVSCQEGDIRISRSSMQNPLAAMQNPRLAMQNPRSAMQNPCSAIRNSRSAMQNPRSAMQNVQLMRCPDNVYHVQESQRDSNHAYSKDEDVVSNVKQTRLTFEQTRDERLKSYGQHADTHDKFQPYVENSTDNSAKTGNANWSSYYQRRCKALKDSGQDMISAVGEPNIGNRINTASKQGAFKDLENNQNVTGCDGERRDRISTRDESRRPAEIEDVHNHMPGSRGKPTCHVTSRELYESPKCGDIRANTYSQSDHHKTVTFYDGATEAHRKLVYDDAPQNDYRERPKDSTSGYGCRKQNTERPRDEKSKVVAMRPSNRRWDDTADSQKVRSNSHTGSSRDKERIVNEGGLAEPRCRVSGPLKEQHVQMLNGRRLSVQKDDDSSTSMSEVDFVVMRSGDIVRRKKSKGQKNDAPATRDTDEGEVVDHAKLDVIAEGRRCLEDEDDYLGDYRCLQLVSRNTKTDNNENDSEPKRHVGFSSKDGLSEASHWAEPKRQDKSKLTGVNKQDDAASVANTSPLKRSATAALQLERDLVAAGKLMEEIEKCKMADSNVGKRPDDAVPDNTNLTKPANVLTDTTKLDLGDRQQTQVLARNKEKSLPSEVKHRSDDMLQKKEIHSTLDEAKENATEVAQR